MRRLLMSKTVVRIASLWSLAPLALAVLTLLALALSVSADWMDPGI